MGASTARAASGEAPPRALSSTARRGAAYAWLCARGAPPRPRRCWRSASLRWVIWTCPRSFQTMALSHRPCPSARLRPCFRPWHPRLRWTTGASRARTHHLSFHPCRPPPQPCLCQGSRCIFLVIHTQGPCHCRRLRRRPRRRFRHRFRGQSTTGGGAQSQFSRLCPRQRLNRPPGPTWRTLTTVSVHCCARLHPHSHLRRHKPACPARLRRREPACPARLRRPWRRARAAASMTSTSSPTAL
mmetsp:Transcript_2105/g.6361  ORF Transcript_2105/g.6361 Transcript_2105/m.6361 type:complete len:243 (-) Transcript_2105:220-948(-)